MVGLDVLLVGSPMQGKSSVMLVHLLLLGLCIILTWSFLAGGYVNGKSNLEVLMANLKLPDVGIFFQINFVKEHFGGCPHFDLIEFLMLLVVASLKLGYDRQSLLDQPSLSVRTLKMGISDRPDDAVDVFHHILEWQD